MPHRSALGWLAWLSSVALFGFPAYQLLEGTPNIEWMVLLLAPALVGLALHIARRPEGLVILGGCAIGWTLSMGLLHGRPVHILSYVGGLGVSALSHRLLRSDGLTIGVRASLLALSSSAALLVASLVWDLLLVRAQVTQRGADWLDVPSVFIPRLCIELLCVVALVSFARGRTRGLLGFVVSHALWLAYGAWVPAAEARNDCSSVRGHPFALGMGMPLLVLGFIAVAPWILPIARFLAGRGPR